MLKNFKKNNNKGFTLVELLVVIAIIGVLAVVAVPSLFNQIEKSKVASVEADISAIKSATLSKFTTGELTVPVASDANAETAGKPETVLAGEIESISRKMGSTYVIAQESADDKDIYLTITGDFSAKAQEKLAKDLDLNYTPASGTAVNDKVNGSVNATTLKYKLIDKN